MPEKKYNIRGNAVANFIYDNLLAPKEKSSYDGPIPAKPVGLNELPPTINMTAAPIKNLSEMNKKTPQEQYVHDVQMEDPTSAYTRKEKKELEDLIEAAKDADVLKDEADLASQKPAGEASADDILPDSDGWVNPAETSNKEERKKAEEEERKKAEEERKRAEEEERKRAEEERKKAEEERKRAEAKAKSKYKLRSIMDAYNEGLLDKESRDYLIVDALSKFARNTGKDLANLAAAYTGGSMNNDRESGIWEERNKAMAEKGIGAEGNQYRAGDKYDLGYKSQEAALESQQLANAKERIKMVPAKNFQEAAEKLRKEGNETGAAIMDLIAAASTQGVDPEEYIAAAYANDPNVKELVDNGIGAISDMAGTLGELTGYVREIVKSAMGKAGESTNKSTVRKVADAALGGNPVYELATNYMDNKNK